MTRHETNKSIRLGGLLGATLLLAVCTCVALINVRAKTKGASTNFGIKNDTEARAAFLEAYKVFMHPRCVNCHPAGDAPLRGDDSRPHTFFRLRRGPDGQGVFAVKCGNCHQARNQPGLHMPPGAPYPLKNGIEDQAHRNEPRWHMPPAAMPMVFEKRTPGQLCRQLLDRRSNGGLTPEQLIDHVTHDPLVLWGWNPGEGRSTPPLSHAEFAGKVREWIEKGSACPK
jgi:mono/diheme cytochrome c family protein